MNIVAKRLRDAERHLLLADAMIESIYRFSEGVEYVLGDKQGDGVLTTTLRGITKHINGSRCEITLAMQESQNDKPLACDLAE